MKIVFTGGGTGGHFYPIIAVAQKCLELAEKEKIVGLKLYFFSPAPYNRKLLFDNNIEFYSVSAGKRRRYFSFLTPFDYLWTAIGVVKALFSLWLIYPDVVFGKGGYASFPTLLAAKLLRIPVVIHESDSVPGRANVWAGKFADKIALSYAEAAEYFDKSKTAYTGQPVRKEILNTMTQGAFEYLHLDRNIPVILIVCGSQGSQIINDTVLESLAELVKKYQVIHQTGEANLKEVSETAKVILENSQFKERYKPFGYLNDMAMRMSAGAASLVVSRAGSTIFEIAAWGLPSIIIPITDSNSDHQRKNAFNFARSGSGIVIEEYNLTPSLLLSEINGLIEDQSRRERMKNAAKSFYRADAAEKIAGEILNIALRHEQ